MKSLLLVFSIWATFSQPDRVKTPGAIFPTATKETVCKPGYATAVRRVTGSMKRSVCRSYGVTVGCPGPGYEIDHAISLQLGGSNDQKNLWPQPWKEARRKDITEDHLHREVCSGKITLKDAQEQIMDSSNWGK